MTQQQRRRVFLTATDNNSESLFRPALTSRAWDTVRQTVHRRVQMPRWVHFTQSGRYTQSVSGHILIVEGELEHFVLKREKLVLRY